MLTELDLLDLSFFKYDKNTWKRVNGLTETFIEFGVQYHMVTKVVSGKLKDSYIGKINNKKHFEEIIS